MKSRIPRLLGALLALVVICVIPLNASSRAVMQGPGSASIRLAHDLEVMAVEVGTFECDSLTGAMTFRPTDELRMQPGTTYGWRAVLKTSRRELSWEERLTLPSAPSQWGVSPSVTLSPDRRSATTRAITTLPSSPSLLSELENYWVFTDGDPTGVYMTEVLIEGRRVATLSLRVKN